MKILLDECLPLDFRHSCPSHDVLQGRPGPKPGGRLKSLTPPMLNDCRLKAGRLGLRLKVA
jgi:hypothetical protein